VDQTQDDRAAAIRTLGLQLGNLLAEARGYLQSVADSLIPPTSPAAFTVLQWLHAHGSTRASDLADALAMDRSALSRLAKQLRDQGLVEAAAATADARGVVLMLTPTARTSVSEVLTRKSGAFSDRLENWATADIQQLAVLLQRLNDSGAAIEGGSSRS
jgi:DNA-binding MarR family transcriptional regulator